MDDLQVEVHTGGDSPRDATPPGICEGYLLKRRKWPLNGWHKVSGPSTCPVPQGVRQVLKLMTFGVSLSDTFSWKQESCATPKVNKM